MIVYLTQGGFMMLPLLVCSVLIIAILIDRYNSLKEDRVIPESLTQLIEDPNTEPELMNEEAKLNESCLGNIVLVLNENKDKDSNTLYKVLGTSFKKEIHYLEKGIEVLSVIAAISPLFGLLGTVLGMVDVFNTIGQEGLGQTGIFSAGIAKALITTIAGLSVSIPALIFHGMLLRKIESQATAIEEISQKFLFRLNTTYVK